MFCRVEPSGIQLWGSISPTRIESMPVNRARPRKERWHVWVFLHSHQTSEHVNVLISQGIVEMLKFSGNTDMLLFFYSCPDQIPDSGQKNLQKKRWFSIICCKKSAAGPTALHRPAVAWIQFQFSRFRNWIFFHRLNVRQRSTPLLCHDEIEASLLFRFNILDERRQSETELWR